MAEASPDPAGTSADVSSSAASSAASSAIISPSQGTTSPPAPSDTSSQVISSVVSTTSSPAGESSVSPTGGATTSQGVTSSQGQTSAPPAGSSGASASANPTSAGGSSAVVSGSASVTPAPGSSGGVSGSAVASSATSIPAGSQSVSGGSTVVYVTVTDGNGSVVVTPTATVGSGGASGGSSKSNTGAIVGGVVGGVAGLALIAILLWFLLKRKRSNRDDFDDMMFDPGRPEHQAPIDLGQEGNDPTVEPYYTAGPASTAQSPEMAQYPRSAATTSDGGYGAQDLSRGPSTGTSAGFAGRGAGAGGYDMQNLATMPMPTAHPTGVALEAAAFGGAAGAGGAAAAKQREAYQESQRFRVQNQGGYAGNNVAGGSGSGYQNDQGAPPMSPTGTSTSGGNVIVHRDAEEGNENYEPEMPAEIPPTYESIGRKA